MKGVKSRYPLPPDILIDYVLSRIHPVPDWGACWIWKGKPKETGYGTFGGAYVKGRTRLAHRRVYEIAVGPIPDGLTLDHLCQRRLCVNPLHLEPVTLAENLRRARIGRQVDSREAYRRRHEVPGAKWLR